MGAAGLAFTGFGLASSSSSGSASDEDVLYSIGTVPPALDANPTAPDTDIPKMPERLEQEGKQADGQEGELKLASSDGDLTRGRNRGSREPSLTPAPGSNTAAPIAVPAPTATPRTGENQKPEPEPVGMEPIAIHIPTIDVFADVVPVGTTPGGAMDAPTSFDDVGWWSPGAKPGENGRAVLAGHVDSPWGPAVFIRLDELEPGDEIIVGDGLSELRYVVRGAAVYRADAAPVHDIFGPSAEQELVLITCGGVFDRPTASYVHRRVVFAVLVQESPVPSAAPANGSQ